MNKMEKTHRFRPSVGKISVQLEDEYYRNEENALIRKIFDNFRFSVPILAKIINFSDLSVFPIFVIFIFKLNANFFGLRPKSTYFRFYSFFQFYLSKLYVNSSRK